MPRRSDEAQSEALEVVEGVVQCVNLEFATVARAGVDLSNRKAAAKSLACTRVERARVPPASPRPYRAALRSVAKTLRPISSFAF